MRTVLITPGWQVSIWNKVARLSESVAKSLSLLGRDVLVITPQIANGGARKRWVDGIHILEVANEPKGQWQVSAAQALQGQRNIDEAVIIDSGAWPPARDMLKGKCPVIGIALFGQSIQGERIASLKTDVLVDEENELIAQADHLLVNNEILRDRISKTFNRSVGKLEMSTSEPPEMTMISETHNGSRNDGEVVVVGKIGPELGLEKVIRAMADLPWVKLKVIGMPRSEWEQNRVNSLISRLGVDERVTFVGWARTREVLSAIRSAEIAVVPSQVEYFGYSVMDAMALGTPVIASAVNIHLELIEDGESGLLFQNQEELKYGLTTLHEMPELWKLYADKALEKVRAERSLQRMVDSLAERITV